MLKLASQLIQESNSEINEYIISIKCPFCAKEVVRLEFARDIDDMDENCLKEVPCCHTVYINNNHCGIYSHPNKHAALKSWVMHNVEIEEGPDFDIDEFSEDLFNEEGDFVYDCYLGTETGEEIALFLHENNPSKEVYYADTCKELGSGPCGDSIAYSVVFQKD